MAARRGGVPSRAGASLWLSFALLLLLAATAATPGRGACYQVGMELFARSGAQTTDVARLRVNGEILKELAPVRFTEGASFFATDGWATAGVPMTATVELAHSYAFWTLRDRKGATFTLSRGQAKSVCHRYWRSASMSYARRVDCETCMIAQKEPWCWSPGSDRSYTDYKIWVVRQQRDEC